MRYLYCHVEEFSMAETLRVLLPKLTKERVQWEVINHGSKDRLLKNLPNRFQGYCALSQVMDLRLLVLVDRDDDNCFVLKEKLEKIAKDKGLVTKSASLPDGSFMVVNRIVVEELEAWFFGDIPALCKAYRRISATLGSNKKFRNPDAIRGGTWEALHREMNKVGYYHGHFPKIEVARNVTPHMSLSANRSASFQAFCQGVEALLV
ncbi:MAG: DUF4276 family protein [Magnetococcus sp. DMHC-1]